jgi:cytochrome c oxidase assembly factor CtaG
MMDIFGEHPSVPIGIAILIAIYLGACRVAGRRPTRRQAMWFAIAMGAILFTHTELDELADARIFSMHMLQHLMQTFVIPPLLLLGTPGWMLRPWVLSRPLKPVARLLTTPVIAFLIFSAVFVTRTFRRSSIGCAATKIFTYSYMCSSWRPASCCGGRS